jgi:hypothetical protein
MAARA